MKEPATHSIANVGQATEMTVPEGRVVRRVVVIKEIVLRKRRVRMG